MFSSQIVSDDRFLEMPATCQLLYFHLGMSADDDGFVSPRKVLRMIGGAEDDIRILIAKGFAIPFESGVIVITHWKQNNYIQKDRYTPSIHKIELAQLGSENRVYILDTQIGRKEESKGYKKLEETQEKPAISSERAAEHFKKGRDILSRNMSAA